MGTKSKKTRKEAEASKLMSIFEKSSKENVREKFLAENVGREIKMSDRTYVIMPDGCYRRTKPKQEIRYSKKREKVLNRKSK